MPFRLLRYMCRIWERWLDADEGRQTLPPIVPLVLHHSETGWTASRSFAALFELDGATRATMARYLPDFEFALDDLTERSERELYERSMSAFARAVLWSMRMSRAPIDHAMLDDWVRLLIEVLRAPHGVEALSIVFRYASKAVSDCAVIDVVAATELDEELKEAIVNIEEQLIARGVQKGIEQGIEQGITEGARIGRADVVLKLLRLRFGELPPAAVATVRAGSIATLDRLAERVLTAASLDDVLR